MSITRLRGACYPNLLAVAVAAAVTPQAFAKDFSIGEIEGSFDSALSVGASWAVRGLSLIHI